MTRCFVAIDPGRDKCGAAILDYSGAVLHRESVSVDALWDRIAFFFTKFPEADHIAMGGGTGSKRVLASLEHSAVKNLPVSVVDETDTTMQARAKYFLEYPPRGLMRLLPRGLRVPPRPVDDFAAVIIGERFLKKREAHE